ncbi:FecCD family ABC transporter permease [Micromonospora sp. LOL_015]|uniref:FecCD family ABC transporter permease n=1 Tax=Micromonospora sp. LOL_015 TaxID=3345416 RepID=UPI003A895C30
MTGTDTRDPDRSNADRYAADRTADLGLPALSRLRRRRRRATVVLAGLAGVVAIFALLSLSLGAYQISLDGVLRTLIGQGSGRDDFIILSLRLPRLVAGILAGAAFGLAGGIFQTLLRNPLASPDIIGVTGGASAAAVFALVTLGAGSLGVSVAAFVGAAGTATAVYLLSWRDGLTGYRFVLVGIAAAFMAHGVLGYLLTRGEVREAQTALSWMVGSLGSARWPEIAVLATLLGVLTPVLLALRPALGLLQFGDDTATGLGVRLERSRISLLAIAVALAAVATAVTGPIAFVAFVAMPIARRMMRSGAPVLLPAALIGVLVVTGADLVAQHLLPGNIKTPVGIVTAVIGGPYLLWLLATAGRNHGSVTRIT